MPTTTNPHGYWITRDEVHPVETPTQMQTLIGTGVRAWPDNVLRDGEDGAVEWAARQIMVEPDEILAMVVWSAGTGTWCVNAMRRAR